MSDELLTIAHEYAKETYNEVKILIDRDYGFELVIPEISYSRVFQTVEDAVKEMRKLIAMEFDKENAFAYIFAGFEANGGDFTQLIDDEGFWVQVGKYLAEKYK